MKQFSKILLSIFFSLLICIPSVLAIFCYTQPMDTLSFDLSLFSEDAEKLDWTVYVNRHGKKRELISDGFGGYSGLDYPGQTFYFSRKIAEALDSLTLRIGTANRCVSVFLDDSLIYTDCPELDNRIGWLELPMLEYDRIEPVIVSLPPNSLGHTLTIAQSSPIFSEKHTNDDTVYPCTITLYGGYSYESELIADTSQTMIPAVLLLALQLFMLIAFLWNAFMGTIVPSLPVLAMASLFQMCRILAQAPFFSHYFKQLPVDFSWLCFHLSVGSLLVFLTIQMQYFRPLLCVVTIFQLGSTIVSSIVQAGFLLEYGDLFLFFVYLPQLIGFVALIIMFLCAFIQWRKGNRFFRYFSQAAFLLVGGYALFLLISFPFLSDYVLSVFQRIAQEVILCLPNFSLKLLWHLCLYSSLIAISMTLIEREARRQTENSVLSIKSELAMESYENLRCQSEEVMMLRHDTMKHYSLLYTMAQETPERLTDYLEQLMGQIQDVRPVVQSGNQILDIIINGKLGIAAEKGISIEIVRSEAPEHLPLTDTELCSLIMNILDNAINASSNPETVNPYMKLDFHCKNQHFIFSCENSMAPMSNTKKISTSGHGYGLKIIRRIMKNWDEMISEESDGNIHKLSIAIHLD